MPKWKADKGPTEGLGKNPLSARYLLFSLFYDQVIAGDAENFVNHILRIFDTDGNDFLSFKEFLLAMDIANCSTSEFKFSLSHTSLQTRRSSTGRSSSMTSTTTASLTSERWPSSCRPSTTSRGSNQGSLRTTETETQITSRHLLKERLLYSQPLTGTTTDR